MIVIGRNMTWYLFQDVYQMLFDHYGLSFSSKIWIYKLKLITTNGIPVSRFIS